MCVGRTYVTMLDGDRAVEVRTQRMTLDGSPGFEIFVNPCGTNHGEGRQVTMVRGGYDQG